MIEPHKLLNQNQSINIIQNLETPYITNISSLNTLTASVSVTPQKVNTEIRRSKKLRALIRGLLVQKDSNMLDFNYPSISLSQTGTDSQCDLNIDEY